ncbi:MAG TPA: MYXO-CTERM sorting domain-containing protein [Polyangiaceae bacterium]|nr:MYXO-CTERM sorting domain-containing protein [Polyangiaceae bacterium]
METMGLLARVRHHRRITALLVLLAPLAVVLLFAHRARAYPGNVTLPGGDTDGNAGVSWGYVTTAAMGGISGGCTGCHGIGGSSGTSPTNLKINGSLLSGVPNFNVSQGSTTTFTLTFETGSGKPNGGFLVYHNDSSANDANGILAINDGNEHACKGSASGSGATTCNGTQSNNTEVTHSAPVAGVVVSGVNTVTFKFKYTAPSFCGVFSFRAWVNDVNGDLHCYNGLDYPISGDFTITATCPTGSQCQGTPTCSSNVCNYPNLTGGSCNDLNNCTYNDTCFFGSCLGTTITCTSDSCNTRSCNGTNTCTSIPLTGTSCNDGLFCNGTDTCSSGTCVHAGNPCLPLNTSDNNCSGSCNEATDSCTANDPNGTGCSDGFSCTTSDTCNGSGTCSGTANGSCDDGNPCTTDTCSPSTVGHDAAGCIHTPLTGTSCNDGNACTQTDTCQAGVCVGSNPVICTASDQCHAAGICNTSTGACSNPNQPNGTTCNDGNGCTTGETCQSGVCGSGAPVTCTPLDQCHTAGVCTAGACTNPLKSNGTSCNDGDACTQTDTCQSGVCTGSNPVVCTASDQCHNAGTCSGGVCSNPAKANGTACNDGDLCTQTDACQAGICTGGNPVTCSALDQCHNAGVCNSATGICSNPNKSDGTACNDGNLCTQTDSCVSGICTGGNPVTCAALDQCHTAGVCNSATGICSNPNKSDGTACNDGNLCTQTDTCQTGTCTGSNPVTCAALDQCHTAGVCNSSTGICSNPNKANGTTCNDGDACTQTDSCQTGVCTGSNPVVCTPLDQCHNAGTCSLGICLNPAKADGSTCNDGNACTQTDTCLSGTCTGANPVVCATPDQCHTAGSCDSSSGVCSNPSKANGTTCNDGKVCTTSDVCTGGVCGGTSVVCNDGIACTVDSCSEAAGGCTYNTSACGCTTNAQCDDGNACNGVETCNLGTLTCQSGTPVDCSPLTNACNTGTCNPSKGTCSAVPKANGTACNDGNACTQTDSCQSGTCTGTNPVTCTALDQCHTAGTCDTTSGVCSNPTKTNGTACTDGNACTNGDTCQSGTCTSGTATVCTALDQCHTAGTCDTTSGACSNPTKTNGTACNDGNACTQSDTCQSGTCTGASPVTCTAKDQCHGVGTCDTTSGLCSNPNKADGTSCNDNNACTRTDTCQSGACTGASPVVCPVPDQCHTAGTCNTSTGTCSNPVKPDGTACDDAKACTTPDTCTAGVCGGAARVCNDGIACTVDSCSESAGGCTVNTSACQCTTNAACDDGDACDGVETCDLSTYTCKKGTAVDCSQLTDPCNTGTCNPANGVCSAVPKPNGTTCNDGNACTQTDTCQVGTCTGSNPVVCTPLDQCHATGACNPANGVCSNPTRADGTSCSDGDACTTTDSCVAGACVAGPALACNDGNPCTVDKCDHSTGCVFTPGGAGAACGPAASCSGGQETLATTCSGLSSTCPAALVKDCAPYACGATACLAACASDSDCAQGNYCSSAGKCVPKAGPGTACVAGNQCLSSFCTDGMCCDSDCTGQCEACNVAGEEGTCSPVKGKPAGTRPACVGDGTGCDGACDGVTRNKCAVPDQSTQCRAPSCDAASNTATLRAVCNGQGSCPAPVTQSCGQEICGATQCTGCSTNADCPSGDFCRGGICSPLAGTGTQCSLDEECGSRHCVDGVCCDSDCTGQCEACNQQGSAGTCTPIPNGQQPAAGRPGCSGAGTQCGGQCDGASTRSCVYPGPGVICRNPDCTNGIATLVAFCDGQGACPPPDQQDCPTGSKCSGTLCAGGTNSCTGDGECSIDQRCAGGVCVSKKDVGTSCNTASECKSGVCADGYCCTSACTGQCEACNVTGSEGQCVPVLGAPHGSRQACGGDSFCSGVCNGTTPDHCFYKGTETQCRSGACANDLATVAATCQGNGFCAPLQQQSCDPVGCDANNVGCAGTCPDTPCGSGQYCSAGLCVPLLSDGAACGAGTQCNSGNCVDGVCCHTTCGGQCQSCNQAGSVGTCAAVTGAPRAGRPACDGSGACSGFCDGMNGAACTLPGADVTCGRGFCLDGAATAAPACRGTGVCVVPASLSCDPYRCDQSSGQCATSCSLDDDCAAGLFCVNGGCTQVTTPPDAGAGGTDAGTPTSGNGGRQTADAGTAAGGASSGGTSASGGKSSGSGGTAGRTGTSASGGSTGQAGGFGVPPVDGGVPFSDGGVVDAGSHAGGKHSNEHDSGGCGCRVTSSRSPREASAFAALGLVALLLRRRGRRNYPSAHEERDGAARPTLGS